MEFVISEKPKSSIKNANTQAMLALEKSLLYIEEMNSSLKARILSFFT